MKKAISEGKIVFTFDGEDAVTFDPSKASAANRNYAMLHGFLHRLGDAAAIPRALPDGRVITVTEAMRRDEVLKLVEYYEGGAEDWNVKKAEGGKRETGAIVIRAIMEATGKDSEAVRAWIAKRLEQTEGLTKAALYASFRKPGTKTGEIIARMEREAASNAKTAVDADEMLNEI